jgi:hypothetical protein
LFASGVTGGHAVDLTADGVELALVVNSKVRPFREPPAIPNLFQLWSTLHNNSSAEGIWSFSTCQSMFAKSNTSADRALVLEREEADNGALATACKKHANCRWYNLAAFKLKFTPNEVNDFDYFHPSLIGQNRLASITWAASWWPEAK